MVIVPVVAAVGLVTGAAVYAASAGTVRRLYQDLLASRSGAVLQAIRAEYDTVVRLGIDDSPFYARSAQNEALAQVSQASGQEVGVVVLGADGKVLASPWEAVGTASSMVIVQSLGRGDTGPGYWGLGYKSFLGWNEAFEPWGWTVILAVPAEYISQAAASSLPAVGVVVLLGIMAASLAARSAGQRVAAPLEALEAATILMGRGEMQVRADETGDGEVLSLAKSFNAMAGELGMATAGLEDQVRARTAELTATIRQLEEARDELVRKEKMAAMVTLVAGVAHEVNTPLGVSITAASYLADQLRSVARGDDPGVVLPNEHLVAATESIDLIQSNLQRARNILRSFKELAADQMTGQRRVIHLGTYLGDILDSIRPELRKHRASVSLSCPQNLELDTWPSAFTQIVSNLIMNSLTHAFRPDEGGILTLDVRQDGSDVVIEYADNGVGMDQDTAARAFEPFFTTRRGAGGTGLGLSIVDSAVSRVLHGSVRMESSPASGTRFVIRFPLHAPDEDEPDA